MDRLVSSPVFIFSPVRAGSTLLRCILGSHSQIHAPHELHLSGLTVHASDMLTRRSLDTLGVTTREIEHLLWDRMLHHELVRSGKQVLVEKTPANVRSWRRIAECWPAARYIFLIRHPANIAASLVRVFEEPVAIKEILEYARAMDEARADLPGPIVRYEDLTTRPAEVVSQLCAFLGVPWEPDMLDYGRFDHGPFDQGPLAPGLGDWSENIRSGRIQPPRPMPALDETPSALKACCQSWGYLESSTQPTFAMTVPDQLPSLPFEQPCVLGVAPLLRRLQAERPITRVRTPAGDEAWLVTHYAGVKELIGDSRFGRSHPLPQRAPRISDSIVLLGAADNYQTEEADHARMRTLLTPYFSATRMGAWRSRVQQLVDELLDALAAKTPPVDLHEALSFPLSSLVICELLGVPREDRDQCRAWAEGMAMHDRQRSSAAAATLVAHLQQVVARKRARPGDDVISGLCAAEGGDLTDEYIAGLAMVLLFGSYETVSFRIDLGILLMLTNPDQRGALLRDPALLISAVEEILRAGGGLGIGLPRYARADIDIGGVTIRAGEAVLLHTGGANHDERVFDDPDRFDITRQPNPHLTFGHGRWFCIGAPLARIEFQAVFGSLIPRFPTLRLAAPVEQLRIRSDLLTGGLVEFPVAW